MFQEVSESPRPGKFCDSLCLGFLIWKVESTVEAERCGSRGLRREAAGPTPAAVVKPE